MGLIGETLHYIRRNGMRYTLLRASQMVRENVLHTYDKVWQAEKPSEAELERQRRELPAWDGLISVLIPVYNTKPVFLEELAASLAAQTWPRWEACLYDGASTDSGTVAALDRLAAADSRLRVVHGTENEGISGNSNRAAAMAKGEWFALCDHDDLLAPDALWRIAGTIAEKQPGLIYTDEDKITEDGRVHTSPHYKPDFCPDNLRSGNYICHLMAMPRELFEKAGGFRTECDGSQDHDLALRCAALTDRIEHIPYTLYHWRTFRGSMSHTRLDACLAAGARASTDQIAQLGWKGRAEVKDGVLRLTYETPKDPTIALILTESGDPAVWGRYYRSVRRLEADWKLRCVMISPWEHSAEELPGNARWLPWQDGSAWPKQANRAVETVRDADYLVFLHGSVLMEGTDWLRELLMYAQRDDVGYVTPMLVKPGGRIIHGGFALGTEQLVSCRGEGLPKTAGGWHGMMRTSHNVAAVSPACCMIRADHFEPFDEGFTGGWAAVDACMRLTEKGLRHVYTPWAVGKCADANTRRWLLLRGGGREEDRAAFLARHGGRITDPCYSGRFIPKDGRYRTP